MKKFAIMLIVIFLFILLFSFNALLASSKEESTSSYSGIWHFDEVVTISTGECIDDIGGVNSSTWQLEVAEDGSALLTLLWHSESTKPLEFVGTLEDNQLTCFSDSITWNCGLDCSSTCNDATISISMTFLNNNNASGKWVGDNCCGDGGGTTASISAHRVYPNAMPWIPLLLLDE